MIDSQPAEEGVPVETRASRTADDELVARLGELNLGSRSAANRTLEQMRDETSDVHKCLVCGQYFDTFADLRKHVKQRKHTKDRDEVKRMRIEFIEERLAADGITTIEQAQLMFDEEEPRAMTPAEQSTWVDCQIQLAWLVRLGSS
jgi:hypothetical protein